MDVESVKSSREIHMKLFFLTVILTFASGCAQIAIGTDPANGVYYTGLDDKGVEADVHGDAQKLSQIADTVLKAHGFQTAAGQQNIDGRNGVNGAIVRMTPGASNTTHIEVIATEGKLCSNMDYAGQILQDIVLAK